jgi:hypothetical protein
MLRHILVTSLLCIGLLGCDKPRLDTSSDAKLVATYTRMRLSVDGEQRDQLDDALSTVAFKGLHDKPILDLLSEPGRILPDARRALDGKTAAQLLAEARRIRKGRDAP